MVCKESFCSSSKESTCRKLLFLTLTDLMTICFLCHTDVTLLIWITLSKLTNQMVYQNWYNGASFCWECSQVFHWSLTSIGLWWFPVWQFELSLSLIFSILMINSRLWGNYFLFLWNRGNITSFNFIWQNKNWNLATRSSKFKFQVAGCFSKTVNQ